jgi:hypothetical protein
MSKKPPSQIGGGRLVVIEGKARLVMQLGAIRRVLVNGKPLDLDFHTAYEVVEADEVCPKCYRPLDNAGRCICGYQVD